MSEKVDVKILEQGDIFFFFRPKVSAKDIKSIEDVRRFYMVLSPEEEQKIIDDTNNNDTNSKEKKIYRLFIIGKKSLPEIRKTEARSSERFWAQVGGIFYDSKNLVEDLTADEYRKGDTARPVGEGKYAIIEHQNHAELAFILEMPQEIGEAQKELGIQKEASYIITVINPYKPVSEGYTTAEAERPKYPKDVQNYLTKTEGKFIPLSQNLTLINYQNAQIILIGAREGKDVIKQEIGLDIETEEGKENLFSSDIFTKLKIRKEQVPIKPIIEGKFQ
jgi:DNA-binding PadR family transcriptional regulator